MIANDESSHLDGNIIEVRLYEAFAIAFWKEKID